MRNDNLERLMAHVENNAFPMKITEDTLAVSGGLTKREYFAGLAMQGLLADGILDFESVADIAVDQADELIEALQKIENPEEKL